MKLCPLCGTDYPNQYVTCEADGAALIITGDLDPGTIVRGKYRIVRKVGRGGMGTVYLADHILLGMPRALKFITSDLAQDPKLLKRFRLEALAAIELRHPNIAEVVDLDQAEDGSPFIAMEFVEGRDLRSALYEGPMAVERALHIARGVAEGLGAAHFKGRVHRDVKPENVLLATRPDGTEIPKLVDFGIAAIRDNVAVSGRTRTGLMLTPEYAAPEQWMGMPSDRIDGRADLYALGGVLHEMLTGRSWLESHDSQDLRALHANAQRQAPSSFRPELRQWQGLDELVLHLLEPDRERRPHDVGEFLHELDRVRQRQAPARAKTKLEARFDPPAPQPPQPPFPRKPKSRWPVIAAACLALVAVAGGGLVWIRTHGSSISPGTLRENPKDGLQYVWIPPGRFMMGCSNGDTDCRDDEKPAHDVTITKGFWMGQTPVTVAAWKKYRAATNTPALLSGDTLGRTNLNEAGPESMPVINESWEQAAGFCQWSGMALPTEAQWEYAARAGTTGKRYGDLDSIAWYGDNSGNQMIDAASWSREAGSNRGDYERRLKDNGNFTHPVGFKRPNKWGLYDMLGNVLEWTNDWYSRDYYAYSPAQDPPGGTGETKALRGGSWANVAEKLRVSSRTSVDPHGQFTAIGFRCVGADLEK